VTSKVVGIDSAKKPDTPCLYCGKSPACPNLTCPRIKFAELFEDGTLAAVEFFEPQIWNPRV
jgi:hypothetical protein